MSSWKEITISGSNPDLKSVFLSGTTTASMETNTNYFPTASNLWLYDFSGDNDDWQTNDANLSDNGGRWISSTRTVTESINISSTHQGFDVSGLSPICLPITITGGSANTGQVGIQSNTSILIDDILNGVDYFHYFNALAALTSSWGSYTLTDGNLTASYEIYSVQRFQNANTRITGESINGVGLSQLNIDDGEICLPPSFTTGSDMYEPLTTGTGPDEGITPSTASSDQGEGYYNVAQAFEAKYLYAETSDPGENTYSITSPYIDVTDYATKKLVFYFHLHGENCGTFKVYTSTSSSSLQGGYLKPIHYSNWPGTAGNLPGGNIADTYWSGGFNNTAPYGFSVGPSEVQESGEAPFNRAEVNLYDFDTGYIWIVYESGNPGIDLEDSPANAPKADFAIGNLYLDLGGYLQPEQFAIVAETPTLEVKSPTLNDFIRFINLPQSDPEVLGALYKHPPDLLSTRSRIRISNGPL